MSKHFNFLLICGTNGLKLGFDSFIKLLLVSFYFGLLEVFNPSLKYFSLFINSILFSFISKDLLWVLVELTIPFQSSETSHLCYFHPREGLPFTWPYSHYLASKRVLFTHFSFLSQLFLQSFDFILFGIKQSCAPSSLGIDRLLFLWIQSALCLNELLHRFSSKTQY